MKRTLKFGFLALSAISGIGGALAFKSHKFTFTGATYYAIATTGTHFQWSKVKPDPTTGVTCANTSVLVYCTIVTRGPQGGNPAFQPVSDQLPSTSDADRIGLINKLYK